VDLLCNLLREAQTWYRARLRDVELAEVDRNDILRLDICAGRGEINVDSSERQAGIGHTDHEPAYTVFELYRCTAATQREVADAQCESLLKDGQQLMRFSAESNIEVLRSAGREP
jgi:hypothetical protein